MESMPSTVRSHTVSAAMAAGYAVAYHLAMWLVATLLYAAPYNGVARILLPICVLVVGFIAFFLLRPSAPEKLTFYGVLLLVQVILTVLMVATPATEWLTALTGNNAPVDSPDGNLSSLYLLYVWLIVGPLSGVLQFLLAVIFVVRDALRGVMGDVKRPRKNTKENPKS